MPRHMLPQTGTIVAYFADPTRRPMAAIVTKKISKALVNLSVFDAEAGTLSGKTSVALMDVGTAPASGAFCTPLPPNDPVNDGNTDVQSATARVTAAAVQTGGTTYAVGDIITLAATTGGAQLRVATVSTGAVATVTIVNVGSAKAGSTPANPVSQLSTTGTGTGATF